MIPAEMSETVSSVLYVLSRMRYPLALVDHILRRKEIMLESPAYQDILDEGKAIGLQQGLEQGLQQGREERLREDVLGVLEVRFKMVPADVEKQVDRIQGRKTLEGLFRNAVLVESLDVFRSLLSEAQDR